MGAISKKSSCLLLSRSDLDRAWADDSTGLLNSIERSFISLGEGRVIFPTKISQILDEESQSRINCMPATLIDERVAGVKWVSVFPENPTNHGLPNVGGLMALTEIETGQLIAVMEAGLLTSLRTSLVDALAAKYLMSPESSTMAILGTGEQAEMHARTFMELFPNIKMCHIAGRNPKKSDALAKHLQDKGLNAIDFGPDYEGAVRDADIIVTCISGQEPLLKERWIKKTTLYCHVGGWEDEEAVAKRASKIICDDWEALKHRASPTISRMYAAGTLLDSDIHCNLSDVVRGVKPGRESDSEFIYFNAIGLSIVDVAVAKWFMHECEALGLGHEFSFAG